MVCHAGTFLLSILNAYHARADKKFRYLEKGDRPWDIFVPCLQSYNDQRRTLLREFLLILDESISEWCPKTSKLGGIPNLSYEPHKPAPLGTMFENGVGCISGVLAFQDIVQGPEKQQQKITLVKIHSLAVITQYHHTHMRCCVR